MKFGYAALLVVWPQVFITLLYEYHTESVYKKSVLTNIEHYNTKTISVWDQSVECIYN